MPVAFESHEQRKAQAALGLLQQLGRRRLRNVQQRSGVGQRARLQNRLKHFDVA
jgi:hypothetical protein